MGRTARIPRELRGRPFTLAEARAAGISLSALRGKSWRRLGSTLYCWIGTGLQPWSVLKAYRAALPATTVFVGRTAAWLHGLDFAPADPVEVAVPPDSHLRSRAGLHVRHCELGHEVSAIKGLPATRLERTLLDICACSPKVDGLTALDMAVHARLTTTDRLLGYADVAKGRPGAARLRALAQLAAPAESPMETRLRWLLIEAGLAAPEVQVDLHDHAGRFIGRADLFYPDAQLVIEFDGGNHRDRLISDDRRQNSLVTAGFRVLRFTSSDLRTRADAVVAEVRGSI